MPIVSAPLPVRYGALAGSGIDYRIDLQGDHDTSGHLFAVDFAEEMAFSGMANVPAGRLFLRTGGGTTECSARPAPGNSRSA